MPVQVIPSDKPGLKRQKRFMRTSRAPILFPTQINPTARSQVQAVAGWRNEPAV